MIVTTKNSRHHQQEEVEIPLEEEAEVQEEGETDIPNKVIIQKNHSGDKDIALKKNLPEHRWLNLFLHAMNFSEMLTDAEVLQSPWKM